MYNYDYEITAYESDEDYQNHFLQIFNTNDIMSDEVTVVLDEIYNLIKDDSDWSKLLCLLTTYYIDSNIHGFPLIAIKIYTKLYMNCIWNFNGKATNNRHKHP